MGDNEPEAGAPRLRTLAKSPTGITGLDEITRGGLPRGRTTLVCGGPGCGKTVLGMEFLVRGALEHGEPGLFVSFEESREDLAQNFRSFGFDLDDLIARKALHVSQVRLTHEDTATAGEFSLDGLFVRLEQGIARVGAKRVVLDTVETLFSHLTNPTLLRAEIARLFRWLKEKGVTSVVTGERGESLLTRHGLEEFVSDCVLLLDHRVTTNISKRRFRIVKYRGSAHGVDEYPFLIGATGLSVFPITSVLLTEDVSSERVGTGVAELDVVLGGAGYYRGSSVLVSGTAGTGKSSLAATFALATAKAGERCLYFSFEEPRSQIVRNMRSIGIDLEPFLESGHLSIRSYRPSFFGLEEHLVSILHAVDEVKPDAVVMDPITSFISVGGAAEVRSMLTRVFDHFKANQITAFFTSLASGASEEADVSVSSLMDTWIVLQHRFSGEQRGCRLRVVKSRGMAHSGDAREMVLSSSGVSLVPVGQRMPQRARATAAPSGDS